MEAKKMIKIFWKDKTVILGTVLLFVVISLFFALLQPLKYVTYLDLEVQKVNQAATSDYQYDEYYAIQSANLVTETINSWFRNRNFERQILTQADFDANNLPALRQFVETRKLAAQNLEIKIISESKKTTQSLRDVLQEVIVERVEKLSVNSSGEPNFQAVITTGPLEMVRPPFLYVGLTSMVAGFLLGIFFVLLFYYFKK